MSIVTQLQFRSACRYVAVCASLVLATGASAAADAVSAYPSKPIRILVPFAPGGGSDIVARQLGPRLTERLGQPIVIDNRPAAAGVLGTELAANAAPNGYTLLVAMSTQAALPALYPKLSFDAIKAFEPITIVVVSPLVAVVSSSSPVTSVQSFIAHARANPRKINFGSSGIGSPVHLAGELFKSMAQIEMTHVVYKGIAPAITALAGNEIQILFPTVFLAQPHVTSGRFRALAVTSLKRSDLAPEWPTIGESGMPGYEASIWWGVMAPAKTDGAIVTRLNKEIVAILQQPEVRQSFSSQGSEVVGSTPGQFARVLSQDVERLGKLIRDRGIRVE